MYILKILQSLYVFKRNLYLDNLTQHYCNPYNSALQHFSSFHLSYSVIHNGPFQSNPFQNFCFALLQNSLSILHFDRFVCPQLFQDLHMIVQRQA